MLNAKEIEDRVDPSRKNVLESIEIDRIKKVEENVTLIQLKMNTSLFILL